MTRVQPLQKGALHFTVSILQFVFVSKGCCYGLLMSAPLQSGHFVLQSDKVESKHLLIPQIAQ